MPGSIGARSGAGGAITGMAGTVAGYALGSAKTAARAGFQARPWSWFKEKPKLKS
ncbi:MAG: hypothetical protein IK089_04865 [Oxalobacter sp.]|nr:hypothetical protein [Oxalobacter sp.]